MVNAVQVKRYLDPLLARNNDLELIGRLLIVKPVRHVLRAIIVDRRSSKEAVHPVWFICHVFGPYPRYHMSWGDKLWSRVWRTTDPEISEALCAEIEKTALPKLRPVLSLQDFMEFVPSTRCGHFLDNSAFYQTLFGIAVGDLGLAQNACQQRACDIPEPGPKEADSTKAEFAGAKQLCELLQKDDIKGLVETLHAWEAANVKAMKIDHLWERTPFPIEEKLGLG